MSIIFFDQADEFHPQLCLSDQCYTKVYHMFFGEAKDQADELITRDILFSQPVVTNKFKLIVNEASPSVAIKMDVIGMPPDKKYEADPVLDPISYEDGNYENDTFY